MFSVAEGNLSAGRCNDGSRTQLVPKKLPYVKCPPGTARFSALASYGFQFVFLRCVVLSSRSSHLFLQFPLMAAYFLGCPFDLRLDSSQCGFHRRLYPRNFGLKAGKVNFSFRIDIRDFKTLSKTSDWLRSGNGSLRFCSFFSRMMLTFRAVFLLR